MPFVCRNIRAMYRSCVGYWPLKKLAELADGPALYVRCQGQCTGVPRYTNLQFQYGTCFISQPSGAQNLQVAARFWKNLCTPEVLSITPEVLSITPEDLSITPEVLSITPEVLSITP
jgi:hypothetical protein